MSSRYDLTSREAHSIPRESDYARPTHDFAAERDACADIEEWEVPVTEDDVAPAPRDHRAAMRRQDGAA
jgi:hypothetical protein